MILTCPDCGTQYVVKDGAIPPEGRQVRCAACKHSWHQDPEVGEPGELELSTELDAAATERAAEAAGPAAEDSHDEDDGFAEAALIEPRSGPEAEERAYEEAVIEGQTDVPLAQGATAAANVGDETADAAATSDTADWRDARNAERSSDVFSPFADESAIERRRSPVSIILLLVLAVVIAAALFWFVAPAELKAKLGIAQAGATPLQVEVTHRDRTPLESGNDLLTVTGRVINPSSKEQDVPPIQAQLKNRSGKVVYSWTIQPDTRKLAGGASASFNSAEVNVPPGADELTITLGDPRA